MGGLLFGYDWVVIGGAKPFYEKFFELTTSSEIGWAMSSALVGCLLGSVISGILSDKFGRKRLLILSGLLFSVSALGTGLANTFSVFVWFRLLGGVGIGLASNLSPMYIAELAPAHLRGKFVSVNQLTIVIGVLTAQFVNWSIAQPVPENAMAQEILYSWNGQTGWRWMFAAETIPAILFFLLMFFVPESPRWLVKNAQDVKARKILLKIGGEIFANTGMDDIKASLIGEIQKVNFRELLDPKMIRILGLGVFLAVLQQWCGINTVFYYAEEIFSAAGYGISAILLNIVITGAVMLIFTFIAIQNVDKWGRKILMLIGAAGLAGTYLILGGGYFVGSEGFHMVILVVTAVAFYSFTLAPITWVLISEIFPNRIRGAAVSVAVFFLWTGCLTLTYTFPFLNENLGTALTYWLYALICIVGFIVMKAKLPETKGKSLEEIEREFVF
jgi:SP family sugar porter-like MFS transporter